MKLRKLNWKSLIDTYGTISKSNLSFYKIAFARNFNQVNEDIEWYIIQHKSIPYPEIEYYIKDFEKYFDNSIRLKVFYFDEKLKHNLRQYERHLKSEINFDLLKLKHTYLKNQSKYCVTKIAESDDERKLIKKGEEYIELDLSRLKTYEDYNNYFKEVIGYDQLLLNLTRLESIFGEYSERIISDEIKRLEMVISKSKELDVREATMSQNPSDEEEYLRLTEGYYKKRFEKLSGYSIHPIYGLSNLYNLKAIEVYGKYFLYYEWLKNKLPKYQNPDSNKKSNKSTMSFDDLFINPIVALEAIEILKKVDPPILNTEDKFIGKEKGVLCIWVDELKRVNLINHYSNRSIYSKLISQRLSPFKISSSMFGKHHKRAEENYLPQLRQHILKLYQDYQK